MKLTMFVQPSGNLPSGLSSACIGMIPTVSTAEVSFAPTTEDDPSEPMVKVWLEDNLKKTSSLSPSTILLPDPVPPELATVPSTRVVPVTRECESNCSQGGFFDQ